jgi:gluconate kinase
LIARRLSARDAHFMPPSLLDSQSAALEEPQADEQPIVLSIRPHPRDMVEEIVMKLGDATSSSGESSALRRAAGPAEPT